MNLFDYSASILGREIAAEEKAYCILPKLKELIIKKGESLGSDFFEIRPQIWVHRTANVSARAELCPPIIICAGAQVRPKAYLRGSVVVGEGAVVGASTEIKNSVLFNGAQVPHLSYVGDSILGRSAHFGAGVIASNLRLDGKNVCIVTDAEKRDTGLRKFGALVGDGAQVGCGAVLCPGTIIGKNAFIYPLVCVRGIVAENSILRSNK